MSKGTKKKHEKKEKLRQIHKLSPFPQFYSMVAGLTAREKQK